MDVSKKKQQSYISSGVRIWSNALTPSSGASLPQEEGRALPHLTAKLRFLLRNPEKVIFPVVYAGECWGWGEVKEKEKSEFWEQSRWARRNQIVDAVGDCRILGATLVVSILFQSHVHLE
nr:hypothetical protein Iba_chr04bCG13220 [Ipomoea batatas]